jgi:transcriptional regulator with XRE-family HTH domain
VHFSNGCTGVDKVSTEQRAAPYGFCGILPIETEMDEYTSPLGQYIVDLLNRHNLSMREASIRADLSPETVSQIVRRGRTTRPRPETLYQLAHALGGDFYHMLELAGHVPPHSDSRDIPIHIRAAVDEIVHIWRKLGDLDPEAQRQLMNIAIIQAEAFLATTQRRTEKEAENTGQTTKTTT